MKPHLRPGRSEARISRACRTSTISPALTLMILLFSLAVTAAACTPKAVDTTPPDPSRPTLTAAATALDKRDNAAFLETLAAPLRQSLADHLDLSGTGPAKLAKVLRDAKLVAEYDRVRTYESKLDGETVTFMAIKEGEKWLLTGL